LIISPKLAYGGGKEVIELFGENAIGRFRMDRVSRIEPLVAHGGSSWVPATVQLGGQGLAGVMTGPG